jgi:hypothetical protein
MWGRVLLELEDLQNAQIRKTLKPKAAQPVTTDEEREAAMT